MHMQRGMLVDKETWDMHCQQVAQLCEHVLRDLRVNPRSSPQVKNWLYHDLALPQHRDPITGNLTTNEAALRALVRDYPELPVLSRLWWARKLLHIRSHFQHERMLYETPLHDHTVSN
jgi:hypothetical protein